MSEREVFGPPCPYCHRPVVYVYGIRVAWVPGRCFSLISNVCDRQPLPARRAP